MSWILLLVSPPALAADWSGGVLVSGVADLPDATRPDESAGFGLDPSLRGQLFVAASPEGPALRVDLGLAGGSGWDRVALLSGGDAQRQDARLFTGDLLLGPQVVLPAPDDARVRLGFGAQAGLSIVGVGQLASDGIEQALGSEGPFRTVQARPKVDGNLRVEVKVHPRIALAVEPGYSLCYTPPAPLGPNPEDPIAERSAFNLNLFRIGVGMRVLPPPSRRTDEASSP